MCVPSARITRSGYSPGGSGATAGDVKASVGNAPVRCGTPGKRGDLYVPAAREEADDHLARRAGRRPVRGGTRAMAGRARDDEEAARRAMGFDPSYVSHVEGRRHRPTEDFARRAEAVLGAGGVDLATLPGVRRAPARPQPPPATVTRRCPAQWLPPGTGLIVEREIAELTYVDGAYRCVVRRALYNAGTEPVTRYLVRIAVDRYPDDPGRLQPAPPRAPAHLRRAATCGRSPARAARRADALAAQATTGTRPRRSGCCSRTTDGRSRSTPASATTIEYAYTVGEEKWGHWFQRAVRLPTRHLTVRLDFPAELDPQVWGVETSLAAEDARCAPRCERHDDGDRAVFDWSPTTRRSTPATGWSGGSAEPRRAHAGPDAQTRRRATGAAASEPDARHRHRAARRRPAPASRPATSSCPREEPARPRRGRPAARTSLARLERAARLQQGRRAGRARSSAWPVRPRWSARPTGRPSRSCCSTRGSSASRADTDEQYEGCLSFFDYRGLVPRPLRIDVEHARCDGSRVITSFEHGDGPAGRARDRPPRGPALRRPDGARRPLVPVEEYQPDRPALALLTGPVGAGGAARRGSQVAEGVVLDAVGGT